MAVVSARASPHSLPSSSLLPPLSPQSLPPSPQPDLERMFMRGGSGRSSNGTSRSTSLREIDEEAAVADDGGGKLYVAVGKDLKDGKSNLLWAARNIPQGVHNLVLLHVHQPAERIMSGDASTLLDSVSPLPALFYSLLDRESSAKIYR